MKNVIDVYGRECLVDNDNKKIYSYNNKDRKINYSAEIIEDGKNTGFYTNYIEEGTLDTIEERLKMINNPLEVEYAYAIGFHARKNDPDRKKWNSIVQYVKENEEYFFDELGDFKKGIINKNLTNSIRKIINEIN